MLVRRSRRLLSVLLPALVLSAPGHALVELEDEQMSAVTGAGLAFVFDDFSLRMAPTSFIELTGTAAQGVGWSRGDARYYGLSITNGEALAGTDWYGNGCDTGSIAGALACPIGNGNTGVGANPFGITNMAPVYDPFVLRVFQYRGYDYAGVYRDTSANMPTILELIGPTNTDRWRWSFWGELEVARGTGGSGNSPADGACNNSLGTCSGGADFLQSQTIIHGKPVTVANVIDTNDDGIPDAPAAAVLRLMRTTGQGASVDSLGLTYQSALSGDFRFSVRQNGDSPDELHHVPDFQDTEGMYFKNVDAFLPLGTLHYQTIILDSTPAKDGNFVIELTRIPNDPRIYNHFYCGDVGNTGDCQLDGSGRILSPNNMTRGYVRWGDFTGVDTSTGAGLPTATDRTNGIYFVGGSDLGNPTVTNIGISRIEGLRIHHLKITSLGAGAP